MAMNRCLIKVALAIGVALALGACGLLAPLMPGVTALAQSRRQQPHPGHEHGHGHVASAFVTGSYVLVFGVPQQVRNLVDALNGKIKDGDWVPVQGQYVHITIDERILDVTDQKTGKDTHEFQASEKTSLDNVIKCKNDKITYMVTHLKTKSNELTFKNMTLKLDHAQTSNEDLLYLKLMLDQTTDCKALNQITGRSLDTWHITVGLFNIKDVDYYRKKEASLNTLIDPKTGEVLSKLKTEEGKLPSSAPLENVRIVRTNNKKAVYDTYAKFPPLP